MQTKRFTKLDEGFTCEHCGREVAPLGYTSRDHCPHCLYSKHVDVLPGDRANTCGGLLRPTQTLPDPKRAFVILYRCEKCGQVHRNVCARDDDEDLLIRMTVAE
ncbi:MAG: RNHCP domain-containing protein [Clostridia bacterium]|nr:RNHCP domain-containing protein [Clostridia bacterium]